MLTTTLLPKGTYTNRSCHGGRKCNIAANPQYPFFTYDKCKANHGAKTNSNRLACHTLRRIWSVFIYIKVYMKCYQLAGEHAYLFKYFSPQKQSFLPLLHPTRVRTLTNHSSGQKPEISVYTQKACIPYVPMYSNESFSHKAGLKIGSRIQPSMLF